MNVLNITIIYTIVSVVVIIGLGTFTKDKGNITLGILWPIGMLLVVATLVATLCYSILSFAMGAKIKVEEN